MMGQLSEKKGFAVWLTGLSGSGKSTIALSVQKELQRRGVVVSIIDGDALRKNLLGRRAYSKKSFSKKKIVKGNKMAALLAKKEAKAGKAVLIAVIAPYREAREFARKTMGAYAEVFLRCPLPVCETRDPKGWYGKFRSGEKVFVVGKNVPYQSPEKPDLELDTSKESVAESSAKVIRMLERKGFL